jgi:hypothetical protein
MVFTTSTTKQIYSKNLILENLQNWEDLKTLDIKFWNYRNLSLGFLTKARAL